MPTFADPAFSRQAVLEAVDGDDFDTLIRAVELTVQAQAFSRFGLQHALNIDSITSEKMTRLLEELRVIGSGELDERRTVLIRIDRLTPLVAELHLTRSLHAA
ncbi:MAG: hypothetical protein JWO10_1051 [Microbacteriaceae bacterium]|nr:hypothetical protein [Microbacteriaceae bacterium]